VQPTIWTGLPETATVVREEIFGPCCHIQPPSTPKKKCWPRPTTTTTAWPPRSGRRKTSGRATARPAQIEVGIWVNSWFLRDLRTPFGGSKQSGIGREGGVHSLEFYTELRNVMHQAVKASSMDANKINAYGDELYQTPAARRARGAR
jgi:aminomuconate-semialdehyde/2-hydroxymuconate-6-semialdehyde dehydrogenase